jgi:hypothetical protein
MSQKAKRMAVELKVMREFAEQLEKKPLLHDFYICGYLDKAIAALQKFAERSQQELSRTDYVQFERTQERFFWPFRPPALAYGLYRLLREHSTARVLAEDAYGRIGQFERDFLGHKVEDTVETIRKQVRRFRRSPLRREMDKLIRRLLTAEWFDISEPNKEKEESGAEGAIVTCKREADGKTPSNPRERS